MQNVILIVQVPLRALTLSPFVFHSVGKTFGRGRLKETIGHYQNVIIVMFDCFMKEYLALAVILL